MKEEDEIRFPRHPMDSLIQIYDCHENWTELEENYDEEKGSVVNREMYIEAKEYVYNLLLRAGDNWQHILSHDVLEMDPYNTFFTFLYEFVPEQQAIHVEYLGLFFSYIWQQVYRCFGWNACKKLPKKVFTLLRELETSRCVPINSNEKENEIEHISFTAKLNNETTKSIIKKAIDNKWIKVEGFHLMWLGPDSKKSKAQLAYFCGKIFGYRYDEARCKNIGNKVPYIELEKLFNVSRLDVALQQVSAAKGKQKWRKIIDSIML